MQRSETTFIVTHLKNNVTAALKGPLPTDIVEEAKRRLDEAGPRPMDA